MTFQPGDRVKVRQDTSDAANIESIIGMPEGGAEVVEVIGDARTKVRGANGEFVFLNERFEKVE